MKQGAISYWRWISGAAVVLLLILWAVWCYVSFQNQKDDACCVDIVRESWHEIRVADKPVLYYVSMDSDSVFVDIAQEREHTVSITKASGLFANRFWWLPWSRGRIITSLDSLAQPKLDVRFLLDRNINQVTDSLNRLAIMKDEMDYFFSVHDVQDEGYELVTAFYEQTVNEIDRLGKVLSTLEECKHSSTLTIVHNALYKAMYKNERDSLVTDTCYVRSEDKARERVFLQLKSGKTPKTAKVVSSYDVGALPLSYAHLSREKVLPDSLDGFGLRVTHEKGVQLGEWKDGKFKGERLEYNTQRIYGIDISRYQHEKGSKRYKINWNKLRITSLGTTSKKRINGQVDYPVSFCYIKATEGISISNKYYAADYAQLRKHGIRVGAYHFFSLKTPADKQAYWFLRNCKYQTGDFPPVLDIEPTVAQVNRMGGSAVLFKAVRTWLKIVESRLGVKPILYISQSFVNRYLVDAPDLKRDYEVWIARYGEYKPDVHMAFWQLSQDGRVAGITPQVDINVFNGYNERFKEFLETHTKK